MRFITSILLFAGIALAVPQTAAAPATTTAAAKPGTTPPTTSDPVSGAANPISYPLGDTPIPANKPITIKWDPTYGTKIDLSLRRGDSDNLDTVLEIAKGIPNSGSYTWTPPAALEGAPDYSIQITSGSSTNYSPKFEVDSNGKGVSVTKSASDSTSTPAPTSTVKSKSGNSTVTSSEEETSTATVKKASASPTSSSNIKAAPDAAGDSAANIVRSPLALLVGVVAALAYFN